MFSSEFPTEAGADSGSADDTDVEHLDVDHAVVDYADAVAHDDSFRDFSDEDDQAVSVLGSQEGQSLAKTEILLGHATKSILWLML